MWQDIIISRIFTKNKIVKGLCTVFPVVANEILIVKDIDDIKGTISDSIRIVCQTWVSKTEFPFSISIYLRDQSLLPKEKKLYHDIYKVGEFCETLNCEAIIGDDTINPYSWILIKSRNDYSPIYVDIEAFDCREPYSID
ncbi:MAG: hypothetical protein ACOYWZ_11470 [Bacillota bacterium]